MLVLYTNTEKALVLQHVSSPLQRVKLKRERGEVRGVYGGVLGCCIHPKQGIQQLQRDKRDWFGEQTAQVEVLLAAHRAEPQTDPL